MAERNKLDKAANVARNFLLLVLAGVVVLVVLALLWRIFIF